MYTALKRVLPRKLEALGFTKFTTGKYRLHKHWYKQQEFCHSDIWVRLERPKMHHEGRIVVEVYTDGIPDGLTRINLPATTDEVMDTIKRIVAKQRMKEAML